MEQLRAFAIEGLPKLIIPVGILVVGWIFAILLGALVRAALQRTQLDDRIAQKVLSEERAKHVDTARWVGKVVYYVALVFVLLLFFQSLQLTAATEPIGGFLNSVFAYVPRLIGAGAILVVAWLAASLSRRLVSAAMKRFDVDRRVTSEISPPPEGEPVESPVAKPIGGSVAGIVYWLVLLLFAPAFLGALRLEGLLAPVQQMVGRTLTFVPNIVSAGVILAMGWFVARILQHLTTNVLSAVGLDKLSERTGLSKVMGKQRLSGVIGIVVYALILIPVAIGALNALRLEAISAPASRMLGTFFGAVPVIFGAALILLVAYVAARLLAGVVRSVLRGVGFDRILGKMGFSKPIEGEQTPSDVAASLTVVAVVYFGAVEAARLLGLTAIAALGVSVAALAGRVLLGLMVFGLGLYLANLAAKAIRQTGVAQADLLAMVGRIAVLALTGAMALRQMGIANEIIELAFGLTLGAVAVAAAIAFGLGGREAASQTLGDMRRRIRAHHGPGEQEQHPAE
jgi:flagellar biosynthesis protein FliQ